jgi:hypothetical protein
VWKVNGTVQSGQTGSSFSSTSFTNEQSVTVEMTANNMCQTSSLATASSGTMTVNSTPPAPSTSDATSNCGSQSLTLSATSPPEYSVTAHHWYTTSAGSSEVTATYLGQVVPVGNPNPYVTNYTNTFSATTSYYVAATNGCGTGPRSRVTATINAPVIPSVSISSSPSFTGGDINGPYISICSGTSVTFTASPYNTVSSPTYQWYSNGNPISGQTGNTYTSSSLTDGEKISVKIACNTTCAASSSATSSNVRMIVNSYVTPSVGISPSNPTICFGNNLTFTASPTNGGSPTYVWKVNGTVQSGQTGSSFSSTSFTNEQSVTVEMTANNMCQTSSLATASSGTITVNSTPPAPSTSDATSNCGAKSLTLSATSAPEQGVTSHHWYTTPTGTTEELSTYLGQVVPIGYPNPYVSKIEKIFSATTTTYYVAASNNCGTSARTQVTATVNATPVIGISANGNVTNVCSLNTGAGTNKFGLTATSGSSYEWWSGTNPLTGATSQTYNPTQSGSYYVKVGTICGLLSSPPIEVTIVTPNTLAATISGPSYIILGSDATFTTTVPSDLATQVNYQWYVNDLPVSNSSTYSSTSFVNRDKIKCTLSQSDSRFCLSPSSLTTAEITLRVNTPPVVEAGTNQTIYLPLQETDITGSASDADGSIVSYNWSQVSGDPVSLGNASTPKLTVLGLTVGTYVFRLTATDNEGVSASDDVSVTVNPMALGFDYNFFRTTILNTGLTDIAEIASLPVDSKNVNVKYYDGLGRPIQQVIWQGSPTRNDIVQPVAYDSYGRDSVKYLPYTDGSDGSYKVNALTNPNSTATTSISRYQTGKQYLFYQNQTNGITADPYPYSKTMYEASPLNRVLEQGAFGATWQPQDASIASSGYTQKIALLTNNIGEVKQWVIANDTVCQLASKATFDAGELFVMQNMDENGNRTREYKDKEGHVVLKKTYITGDSLQTYYVYDNYGLLRYVLPPKAVQSISATTLNPSTTVVKQLCYYYNYDSRNRMILKQLPGAAPVYIVYDQRDRVVLTQDGERRKDNQWIFTKYDVFNRTVITGITTNKLPFDKLQDTVNLRTSYKLYESVTAETGNIHNYSNNSFPKVNSGDSCLTVTYYDTYTFPGKVDFTPELTNTAFNPAVKGQVTGTKVRILGTTTWLGTTNYYDDKYRAIQTIRQNNIGGLDRVTNKYDFVGKIDSSRYTHTGTKDITIAKRFEYDHARRLLRIFHKIDSNPEVLMSYMQYNEIGQLVNKKLHSSDTPHLNYLQSIDYRYNIRGWLTKINGPETVNIPHANDGNMTVKPDAFGMEIRYNDPFNQ